MTLPGCVGGSLASGTGPRQVGQAWSVTNLQRVHVGETVGFNFVLVDWAGRFVPPGGLADYCVTYIEGQRVEAEPDLDGDFPFDWTFDSQSDGDQVTVTTTAYMQLDRRDFMQIGSDWVQTQSPSNIPDRAMATDSIRLAFYQARVEIVLPDVAGVLQADTGVLQFTLDDGAVKRVYVDRPGRPGFVMSGPDDRGTYLFSYRPRWDEINSVGRTRVVLKIHDTGGRVYEVETSLDTP